MNEKESEKFTEEELDVELDLINCYTGIPTQALLKELEGVKTSEDDKYMAEERNMAIRHMAKQYMTPSEKDTPQTSKIVLEQVSEKRTDRKMESIRPILAAFPGDKTSEDEKYMADRHMAM